MKVALDTFARAGIETRLGCDLAAGVRTALQHYTQRCESGPTAPIFPRFRRQRPLSLRQAEAEFELAIDPEIQAALEHEAHERLGVPVEQLAGHAVLVYLADLDRELPERPARPLARL